MLCVAFVLLFCISYRIARIVFCIVFHVLVFHVLCSVVYWMVCIVLYCPCCNIFGIVMYFVLYSMYSVVCIVM